MSVFIVRLGIALSWTCHVVDLRRSVRLGLMAEIFSLVIWSAAIVVRRGLIWVSQLHFGGEGIQ